MSIQSYYCNRASAVSLIPSGVHIERPSMSGNERFELISIKRLSNNNYVDNMYRVLHVVLNNNYEMIVQLSSCSTNRIKMYLLDSDIFRTLILISLVSKR